MIEQQLKMKQGSGPMTMPSANGNAQSMAMAAAQQPAQVAAGQPDYSKQWAEYYRSIGKNDEAEAIESQIKTKVSNCRANGSIRMRRLCKNHYHLPVRLFLFIPNSAWFGTITIGWSKCERIQCCAKLSGRPATDAKQLQSVCSVLCWSNSGRWSR